jgi:polyisoprenoid-binding protein YceI
MSTTAVSTTPAGPRVGISDGPWQLDPERSTIEFRVRGLWGLATVKGRFDRFAGILDLASGPTIDLRIEADSVNTNVKRRDAHLRSRDFFDVSTYPEIRFVGERVTLDGETLSVDGRLRALGREIQLKVGAVVRKVAGGLELEANAVVDQRELGMTWNPLRMIRSPSVLHVRGYLVPARGQE